MKRSIKRLPQQTQEELNVLLKLITYHIPKCEMIILFGSYARGGYVLWDEKVEFGVHTSYQSDLDIMVVINQSNTRITEYKLRNKVLPPYFKAFEHRRYAIPQFIVEDAAILNKELEKKQYFYTDIVKEGIKLYDSKVVKLAKPLPLSFKEIKQIAVDEFNIYYPDGETFIQQGKFLFDNNKFKIGSFDCHQACERFYNAITLVFTNYRPKSHKLPTLYARVKEYSRELSIVFPQTTDFETRCYDLLCRAYIEARYNKDFMVTKEELEYMLQRTEVLKDITYRLCNEKIASYDGLIEEEEREQNRKDK